MRRLLSFPCEGASLAATLDEARGSTGLLIVSGGNEIRIGAHRGMAKLARDMAAAGHPVFRFDRRGIGDSEGSNAEFRGSAADIHAAIAAFKAACPHLTTIIGFGNCDAASALVLHLAKVDALVLANPWVFEAVDDLPPPAAIRARYSQMLFDPKAWGRLFSGAINVRKAVDGLMRIAAPPAASTLAQDVIDGITAFPGDVSILLAERDATAIAFADVWRKSARRSDANVIMIDSASHSFASDNDYAVLFRLVLSRLARDN
jgi:exosortase A-associated hydrolase 1